MKLKKIFTTLLVILSFQFLNAQKTTKITGRIVDEEKKPLPYVNIIVLTNQDSKFIKGTTSNDNGQFIIENLTNPEFKLRITYLGYKTYTSKVLMQQNTSINLGEIILISDSENLDEVVITTMRPTITMKADKMVVSVEGTAMAQGATAFEVLEKSPGIFIDQNGNIQLNGQGGIRVLINNKPVFISGAELQNKLEGMSAEEIKNIEIISNPSSKYDAAGTGGIVNIQLKKNNIVGTNGNISTGYAYNGFSAYNGQANINYKKNQWNSFTNFGFRRRYRPREQEVYREFNSVQGSTVFNQTGKQDHVQASPNISLGTEFEINEKQSISASINTTANFSDFNFDTKTYISDNLIENVFTDSKNLNESELYSFSSNLHYSIVFDEHGRKLTSDFNYVKLNNENENFFTNSFFDLPNLNLTSEEKLESNNPVKYDIFSGQIDYETPAFKTGKMEMGLKYSSVKSDNEILFFENINGVNEIDENRTSHFIFSEDIVAGYINYSSRIGKKTSFNLGLRAEQTYNTGRSITLNTTNKREYLNLFPSLFIQHNFSKKYQTNLNYSRRIDRPRYNDLNPFIFYLDPFTWATGNTSLTPQFTHSIKLTQVFNKRYYLLLNYSNTEDFISQVPFQNNNNNTTIYIPSNINDTELLYATLVVPFKMNKWWSVNNNITASNQKFSFVINNNVITNNVFSWQARSDHSFYLQKDLRFEMGINYRSEFAYGLITYENNWGMDLAIKKSFMKRKLNLTIGSFDVFRTRYVNNSSNINGNINEVKQYFGIQNIRFALSYNFSNGEKFRSKRRGNQLDELKRTQE